MTEKLHVLTVSLAGTPIGNLTYLGQDRSLFTFQETYLENPNRPTLSLSFKDQFGQILSNFPPTQTKLLPFFANLLPEENLRHYLAERAHVHPERDFFLLWALGQDLPGAVTVENAENSLFPEESHRPPDLLKPSAPTTPQEAPALRFSLAGVQLKFSALAQATGGLTIPTSGAGGDWIVKLPSAHFPNVPENEFAMMSLAQKVGINVPEIALLPVSDIGNLPNLPLGKDNFGRHAFAIRRFDRSPTGAAIHMEDFAQIFGVYPQDKYRKGRIRNIANVLQLETSPDDVQEFIRRLVFNSLIGNADMHLKNWSLLYRDPQRPSLAPAYDFLSTIAFLPDDNAALKLSRSRAFRDVTEDELRHLCTKALLPTHQVLETARDTAEATRTLWHSEKNHLPLPTSHKTAIDAHMSKIPL